MGFTTGERMRSAGSTTLCAVAVATALVSPLHAQGCELYGAALATVGAASSTTLLNDKTAMGIPGFAFLAHTTKAVGDTALARVATPLLIPANASRAPVPACLADSLGWHTITDSALFAFFKPPATRWTALRAAYPATPAFALLSRPVIIGDTAYIYVAIARDDLAGEGHIVKLVRGTDGHWAKVADVRIWIS
jgi:hypothetical protein